MIEKDLLPGNLKDQIKVKDTRQQKVQCLLDDMEGGILCGYNDRFDGLLQVLEEYAAGKNHIEAQRLVEDVRWQLSHQMSSHHVSSFKKSMKVSLSVL